MMFEIRVVVLTPESYNIAHERPFYFCIKKKKKSFKVCMFSDCFQAMSLFWYTYLF